LWQFSQSFATSLDLRQMVSSFILSSMRDDFHWPEFLPAFTDEAQAAGFLVEHLATVEGGKLNAWERPTDGPRIYLSAGMHGDEPAGPLALLELLRQGYFKHPVHWIICPALNPGGLANGIRENSLGVDLNRDYWLKSTPEVTAHATWLDSKPAPDLFVSLHEDWETKGFYFYEINLKEDMPERARKILTAVEPWFNPEAGPEIDGHEVRSSGWIYHAAEPDLPESWPEAIYLAKLGCPLSFTFETPSGAPLANRVAAHVAALKAVCDWVIG
jgi:protein MpaA